MTKYLMLLLLAGCAVKLQTEGTVYVKHQLDIENLYKVFKDDCLANHPNYAEYQIEDCAQDLMDNFLKLLDGSN